MEILVTLKSQRRDKMKTYLSFDIWIRGFEGGRESFLSLLFSLRKSKKRCVGFPLVACISEITTIISHASYIVKTPTTIYIYIYICISHNLTT